MKNKEFQITFCETNLRWLAGEPPSDERTRKQQAMMQEIDRLKKVDKPIRCSYCLRSMENCSCSDMDVSPDIGDN